MSLDFATAKMQHANWKGKLRSFLDGKGKLTLAEATSHKDCDLGKWLYSQGLAKYGEISDMHRLEKEHEKLHQTIKRIVEFKNAGKTGEAETEFAKVEPSSKTIIDLLSAIDARLSAHVG